MEFICLAAGQGTRLGRLGAYLQKCMYPVGLKPFLEHTLDQLLASGQAQPGRDRIALVVGHHGDQVRDYFGDRFAGIEIEYVEQTERRGTGHALDLAARRLQPTGSVIAWQADLLVTSPMFSQIVRHRTATVVTLGPGHEDESPVLRATTRGERATRVWEGEGPLLDVGLWKLEPTVLAEIGLETAAGGEVRMLRNLQRSIDRGVDVGFVVTDDWIHLGGTLPSAELNVRRVVERVHQVVAGGQA